MKHDLESFILSDDKGGTAAPFARSRQARSLYLTFGKRLFDLICVALALPLLLPLIAILAVLVMRDGGAPFFGHVRIGRNGREFRCWKLRSMIPSAEAVLRLHLRDNPGARREWELNFKLENDPRITRFGRFLRKSSLDELPQIWNILKGEMSLVGPRPVTRKELPLYGEAMGNYKAMLPGLTGLWQVSGRNDLSYAERVALDLKYQASCSLFADIRIIFLTIGAVLSRTGR
ncbi:sugar transferase [Xinfangfangia sp. D13-10-4-6]|uniref:sugar transferase n=1 Tax=Pseudogemmobacter hezensis TaxID=2737662 RepID=UPI00155521CA|nr:sugar transferase [Pseudogemmobacter hezensis]NPD14322.1 sugar transferase [Pseudogemmobacter hezensis]